jgi:hypothetical protein
LGKGNIVNKSCWCGSGRKYKKCHGSNIKETKVKPSDMDNDFKEALKKDVCYAPLEYQSECDSIIKAHTISKSNNLKLISDNGYVFGFKGGTGSLTHNNGKFKVEKVSIKSTSIFHGFCAKHDKELFDQIDKTFILTEEQIFLNLYRTLSRELYLKKNITSHQSKNMVNYDKGLDPIHKMFFQNFLKDVSAGTLEGHKDLEMVKLVLDNKLVSNDFTNIKYYAFILNNIPDIMSTAVWIASQDLKNNTLVDLMDMTKRFNLISISSLVYEENKGIILFSWVDDLESNECYQFIKSLDELSNEDKIKAFINLIFSINENIFFSPKWWESIGEDKQKQLIDIFHNTLIDMPNLSKFQDIDVVKWEINEIKTNITL